MDTICVERREEEKGVGMKLLLQKKIAHLRGDRSRRMYRTRFQPGVSTRNRLLTRVWVQVFLGLMSAAFLALTILFPDWIEILFGLAPDAGDSSAEWVLALSWAFVSVLMFAFAGRTWRKRVRLLRQA